MASPRPPYAPADYVASPTHRALIWKRADAAAEPCEAVLDDVIGTVEHEVAHVAVALQTKSEKRLGDGNRSMRVRSWVNEGFACVVAAFASNRGDLLERQVTRAVEASIDDLDAALDDLSDERRANGFAVATARVWTTVQVRGLGHVFRNLDQSELF